MCAAHPRPGPALDGLWAVVLAYGPREYGAVVARLLAEGLPEAQIMVVHNPRRPGEAALADHPRGIRVVRMDVNGGYAIAMNAGMRAARDAGASRVLLLTHDAAMNDGALAELADTARRAPRPGICGPCLRWSDEEWGVYRTAYGGWWTPGGRVGHHDDGPLPLAPAVDGLAACDWVDGAVMLVDIAVLEATGGLDEGFFLYFEETEFCLRAGRAGFSVTCATEAVFEQSTGALSRPGAYGYLSVRNGLEFTRRLAGPRAVPGAIARALSGLPLLRCVRPSHGAQQRRLHRRLAFGSLAGLLAFLAGHRGAPPRWLPGQGDVRSGGGRGLLARLGLGLLTALTLGACGELDRPEGAVLFGPAGPPTANCSADRNQAADARKAQVGRDLILGLDVGLQFETSAESRCALANLAQGTGASLLREDFDWDAIEPSPGAFDWSGPDAIVRTAAQRGMTVLPIVGGGRPSWAGVDDGNALGRFVGAAARRYAPDGPFFSRSDTPDGPGIVWWELLNEPFEVSNPDYLPSDRYARLVAQAAPVIRADAPGVRLLLAGEAQYETPDEFRQDWTAELLDAVPDLGSAFDGVAVHPYGGEPAPYDAAKGRAQPGRLERVRQTLVERGLADKPLWVTEIGWSTCTGDEVCVTRAEQGAFLDEFLELARTRWKGYVRVVVPYQLRENAMGRRPADKLRFFGLLDGEFRAKPALGVFETAARR